MSRRCGLISAGHADPAPTDVLPSNPLFLGTQLSAQEATYAYSAWIFAQHFLNRLGPTYSALKDLLNENDSVQAGVLSDIRARLRQETFTRGSILEALQQYPDVIRLAYISFAYNHYYNVFGNSLVYVSLLSERDLLLIQLVLISQFTQPDSLVRAPAVRRGP